MLQGRIFDMWQAVRRDIIEELKKKSKGNSISALAARRAAFDALHKGITLGEMNERVNQHSDKHLAAVVAGQLAAAVFRDRIAMTPKQIAEQAMAIALEIGNTHRKLLPHGVADTGGNHT